MSVNINMSKKVQKKKMIKYKGKNVYYTNIPALAKKLKIDKDTARNLVSDYLNNDTIKYLEKDGDIIKYDTKTKPLFLRDFGIKKIENKQLLNEGSIKGVEISNDIPINAPLQLTITAHLIIKISAEVIYRKTTFQDYIDSSSIDDDYVLEKCLPYLTSFGTNVNFDVSLEKFVIQSSFTEQEFKFEDMKLYNAPKHLPINSLFNEVIENKSWKDCVYDFMVSQYPKLSKKKLKGLRTINDLKNWSIDADIKMLCYDINGNIVSSHYPLKKSKKKNLVFIAYNSHLYPLKNTKLSKCKKPKDITLKFMKEDDGLNELIWFLEHGTLPYNIYFQDDIVKLFMVEIQGKFIQYVDNKDYEVCSKILHNLGLSDKLSSLTNLKNIGEIIEPIYIKENIQSFIPKNNRFIKGGFNYTRDFMVEDNMNIHNQELTTIDKNKAYSSALQGLKMLINTDFRKDKFLEVNYHSSKDIKIEPHYLYVASPEQSSLLMENINLYSGEHLLFCKNVGLKFIIKEVLETSKTKNYYKELIDDLWIKLDEKQFKTVINIMIGKMERNNEMRLSQNVLKIMDEEERKCSEGLMKRLNDKYSVLLDNNEKFDLYNKKPIALQVKESSRRTIYKMCESLKLNESNVVQIKTDSITFISNDKLKKQIKKHINKDLDGWKLEDYSPINTTIPYLTQNLSLKYNTLKNNNNILANCYAGAGKTHIILNKLIPKLIKEEQNFIVLTPSHSTIREYRKADVNCKVIQTYTLGMTSIPFEKNIIIDEIGMVDRAGWDMIYKCYIAGKRIFAYGDFKQLKAVDGNVYDSENFLNLIFGIQLNINTNYRNNFTKKYYDSLMNASNNKQSKLIEEMKKHRHKYYNKAEVIVCYRNQTKDKYNLLMAKHLNIKHTRSIGAKVISITNIHKKIGIFNKFCYTVVDTNNEFIILNDGESNYDVPIDKFNNEFDFSYARTLYSVQGETLSSFFYPNEDLYFLDGRTTYTLISRLKQKLEETQITLNNYYIPHEYNEITNEKYFGISLQDRELMKTQNISGEQL